ncbi:uncharacterized protein VTP21DRAFT_3299 [Calcarisporiella thermophila]|uniref:uncharacterized protein n=1 Tax=Calcarisporiella thermophila TaxID=911321 RepID=UPI0037428696
MAQSDILIKEDLMKAPTPQSAETAGTEFSVDLSRCELICDNPSIYGVTASYYFEIQDLYHRTPLPNDILFPWLHGVDGKNYHQNLFFNVTKVEIPQHRGLTVVHGGDDVRRCSIVGSVLPGEILASATAATPPPSVDAVSSNADEQQPTDQRNFVQSENSEPLINLRNFKIQVAKYALISDIVVYGENGVDEKVLEIAKQISWAQQALRADPSTRPKLEYHTFVITDPFSVIEEQFPSLVLLDSKGMPVNKFNFWEEEREEMRLLTTASEISPHIWLGNTQNVPSLPALDPVAMDIESAGQLQSPEFAAKSQDQTLDGDPPAPTLNHEGHSHNPHNISICIEAHELAEMPTPSTLTLARETINDFLVTTSKPPPELIHLDMLSSGAGLTTPAMFEDFMHRLLHLLAFMDDQASRAQNILIHCQDGYTETSLLALSWLMYKFHLRLPEAYLKLQETRSFFVYAVDLEVLKRIETRIWRLILGKDSLSDILGSGNGVAKRPAEADQNGVGKQTKKINGHGAQEPSPISSESGNNGKQTPNTNDTEKATNHDHQSNLADGDTGSHENGASGELNSANTHANQDNEEDKEMELCEAIDDEDDGSEDVIIEDDDDIVEDDDDDDSDLEAFGNFSDVPPMILAAPCSGLIYGTDPFAGDPALDVLQRESRERFPWFYVPQFEGSFPSRIQPFLYLGNLNHASNPAMLRALGITHVVSVGEFANLPRDTFELKFVENCFDDGIDSLWHYIDECVEFIENARRQNGTVLVHCRVGVSRSATIVIAYVMYHLNLSLAQAYLYVRARRLNVIIQPNLKFMYELLQHEHRLRGRRSIFWSVLAKEVHALNLCYIN